MSLPSSRPGARTVRRHANGEQSTFLCAACSMSPRYFRESRHIDERPGLVDRLTEVRVRDGGGDHKVDGSLEQRVQALEQAEVGVGVCANRERLERPDL